MKNKALAIILDAAEGELSSLRDLLSEIGYDVELEQRADALEEALDSFKNYKGEIIL